VTALIVGTSDDRSVADAMLYRIGDAEISADAILHNALSTARIKPCCQHER